MINKETITKIVMTAFVAFQITGCSSWFSPSGHDEFECDRSKGNVSDKCKGVVGVLRSTNGKMPSTDYDSKFSMEQFYRDEGLISDKTAKKDKDILIANVLPHSAISKKETIQDGAPVRVAPVTIKIRVNEYVSDSDMLVRKHDVYKEVMPSHWNGYKPVSERKQENAEFYPHFAPKPGDKSSNESRVSADDGRSSSAENVGQVTPTPDFNMLANQKPQ